VPTLTQAKPCLWSLPSEALLTDSQCADQVGQRQLLGGWLAGWLASWVAGVDGDGPELAGWLLARLLCFASSLTIVARRFFSLFLRPWSTFRAIVNLGSQSITTNDGCTFPLDLQNGLPFLKLRPYTDKEWDTSPTVIMTEDMEWNPRHYDQGVSNGQAWHDKQPDDDR